MSGDNEGRDLSYATKRQEMSNIASNPPETKKDSFRFHSDHGPDDTMISDF